MTVVRAPKKRGGRGRLAAYLRLFDPAPVSVVVGAATLYAFVAARGAPPLARLAPFLLALLLTQFAIAFHNHYCDRDLDRLARPWRALPRGLVPPRLLLTLAWALFAAGLGVAATLGVEVATLVALGTGSGFLYNAFFKRTPWSWLPYWLALPTLVVCVFAVVGRTQPALPYTYLIGLPVVVAVHLGDALSESELDAAHGARGLAQWLGRGRGLGLCWGALALALVLALLSRPSYGPPGAAYGAAAGLLLLVGLTSLASARRLHWAGVMATAVCLGLGWVTDLAV